MQSGNRFSWWHGCDITRPPSPSLPRYPKQISGIPLPHSSLLPAKFLFHSLTLLLLVLATEAPDDVVVPVSLDAAVVIGAGRGDVGDGGERARPAAVALQRVPVQSSVCGKEGSRLRQNVRTFVPLPTLSWSQSRNLSVPSVASSKYYTRFYSSFPVPVKLPPFTI